MRSSGIVIAGWPKADVAIQSRRKPYVLWIAASRHSPSGRTGVFRRRGDGVGSTANHPALARRTLRAISIGVVLLAGGAAPAAWGAGRVLTAMDVVAIRIVDHPELEWTARVEPDGTIAFPYLGRIKAAGRTEDELARAVELGLTKRKILAGP